MWSTEGVVKWTITKYTEPSKIRLFLWEGCKYEAPPFWMWRRVVSQIVAALQRQDGGETFSCEPARRPVPPYHSHH